MVRVGGRLGWVVSAYLLGYALALLVVLPLTDRVPLTRVIGVGALVTSLANVALAVPPSPKPGALPS